MFLCSSYYLLVRFFVCLSVPFYVHLLICWSGFLPATLPPCLPACLRVCLSVRLGLLFLPACPPPPTLLVSLWLPTSFIPGLLTRLPIILPVYLLVPHLLSILSIPSSFSPSIRHALPLNIYPLSWVQLAPRLAHPSLCIQPRIQSHIHSTVPLSIYPLHVSVYINGSITDLSFYSLNLSSIHLLVLRVAFV